MPRARSPRCLTREPFFGRACLRSPVSRKRGKHQSIKHRFSPPRCSTDKTKGICASLCLLHVLQRARCCAPTLSGHGRVLLCEPRFASGTRHCSVPPTAAGGGQRLLIQGAAFLTPEYTHRSVLLSAHGFPKFCCFGLCQKDGRNTRQTNKQK